MAFTRENIAQCKDFLEGALGTWSVSIDDDECFVTVLTAAGEQKAPLGSWIVKRDESDFEVLTREAFEARFERAPEADQDACCCHESLTELSSQEVLEAARVFEHRSFSCGDSLVDSLSAAFQQVMQSRKQNASFLRKGRE